MAKKKAKKFAIIDLETTGGMAKRDKITEIAIVLHDGEKELDRFDTLINPERSIPYEITRITGITNDMVADAPKFYEVAKKVVEMTKGAIFVAHNVRFDYSFIQQEFARLGYTYTRKQLCTVRMSRKAFPGLKSYSLGNLIRHFDIKVSARHRALDDTLATVQVFEKMLHQSIHKDDVMVMINRGIREQKLPEGISIEMLHELPEKAGVYYFHNNAGAVVYVGKSINIKKRVMQHFSKITSKSTEMIKQVKDITYEVTGHELLALLQESEEIKALQPIINKAQRTKDYPYFIYSYMDEDGYLNFDVLKTSKKIKIGKKVLSHYGSLQAAKSTLGMIQGVYQLCETKIHYRSQVRDKCMNYVMGSCLGACRQEEAADDYNERAELAEWHIERVFDKDFILLTDGRTKEEKGVVLIEDKHYRGFGYISNEDAQYGIEELKEAVNYTSPNDEKNQIIATYMHKKNDFKVIEI